MLGLPRSGSVLLLIRRDSPKRACMLATILKSPQAVYATLAIIETFSKIRELSHNIKTLSNLKDKDEKQNLMQKSGEIIAELLDDDLQTTDTETSIELNFAVLKFKQTIKKKNK